MSGLYEKKRTLVPHNHALSKAIQQATESQLVIKKARPNDNQAKSDVFIDRRRARAKVTLATRA